MDYARTDNCADGFTDCPVRKNKKEYRLMHSLKILGKILLVVGTIMMLAVPAMAGKQTKTGSGQSSGDRTRTPGSCKSIETNNDSITLQTIAARYGNGGGTNQGTRDRTRTPGSCKVAS